MLRVSHPETANPETERNAMTFLIGPNSSVLTAGWTRAPEAVI